MRSFHSKRGNLKRRAKEKGVEFNLTKYDIGEIYRRYSHGCPMCLMPFSSEYSSKRPNSKPTIDRIVPELGYVRGNVQILCSACNTLKARTSNYHRPINHHSVHNLARLDLIGDLPIASLISIVSDLWV